MIIIIRHFWLLTPFSPAQHPLWMSGYTTYVYLPLKVLTSPYEMTSFTNSDWSSKSCTQQCRIVMRAWRKHLKLLIFFWKFLTILPPRISNKGDKVEENINSRLNYSHWMETFYTLQEMSFVLLFSLSTLSYNVNPKAVTSLQSIYNMLLGYCLTETKGLNALKCVPMKSCPFNRQPDSARLGWRKITT